MENIVFQQPKMRIVHTPAMRFQPRDGAILQALFAYDGILARRHLKAMFWPNASKQAMERRFSILHQHAYLNWPDEAQRRTKPIPEPVVWLGWKGILYLAGQAGLTVESPNNSGENQMRILDIKLRRLGIHWQREPRWSQLAHDLAVVDFRLAIEMAVASTPTIEMEDWIAEGEFLCQSDVTEFSYTDKTNKVKRGKKGVRPDGYFVLLDRERNAKGLPARARFLLELDFATHPLSRFAAHKVAAGFAYIHSQAYKTRFGANAGRWLVVCSGERRMGNLKQLTETTLGLSASAFYFTTFDKVSLNLVLTAPIWMRGGSNDLQRLLD